MNSSCKIPAGTIIRWKDGAVRPFIFYFYPQPRQTDTIEVGDYFIIASEMSELHYDTSYIPVITKYGTLGVIGLRWLTDPHTRNHFICVK